MGSLSFCRRWAVPVLAVALIADCNTADAGGAKWLPDQPDIVVTLNVRQFLLDHKQTDAVQDLVKQWRSVKPLGDLLGVNPLEDIDRVTAAFRRDAADAWVVIVEGRFHADRLGTAIQLLGQQSTRPFKTIRVGKTDVWQIPDNANGICIALLDKDTLVISGRKAAIADLAKRADDAKDDPLSRERRVLLEHLEKQHVGLFVDHVDTLLTDAHAPWLNEAARVLGADNDALTKAVLTQLAAWRSRYGKDITCASLGLSIRSQDSNLHVGVLARKPATARDLAAQLDGIRVLAAIAAKANDKERVRQLGDILLRARVTKSDAAVAIDVPVPHAFVQAALADAENALRPLSEQLTRRIMSIPLWQLPEPPDVREVRDVAYRSGPLTDPIRHRADLFLPRGKEDFPVVVLVHGGGWTIGDNRCCGLYSSVGQFLASQGIGVVLPNYRLSPAVTHPEHIRDVARAVRWTHDHIAEYGGDPKRIYLMGHSAGGHLVALLATDESYLKAEGLGTGDIKGVIPVSGVYRILPGTLKIAVGGTGSRCFRPDQLLPLRDETGVVLTLPALGVNIMSNIFDPPFGADAKTRAAASPINHVHKGMPPFLMVDAERDLPTLKDMATEFHKALAREGCTARLLELKNRNHNTVMFSIIRPDDPAARAVLDFIK
jgi:arylformamidase